MRTYLHFTLAMILFTSCFSVSKLYERGRFEDAYEKGVKKLVGSKKIKEADLIALEAAYYKLESNDLFAIKNLESSNDINRWEKIASIYAGLQGRKLEVERLWKNNKSLVLVDYNEMIKNAENSAFDSYFKQAKIELVKAKDYKDKSYARTAHHLFLKAQRYNNSIEISELINESYALGIMRVGLYIVDNGYREDELFHDQLLNMNLHSLSNFWVKYDWAIASEDYDQYVDINMIDIDLHNGNEIVNKHHFKSIVQDGYEFKKDEKGKVLLDSMSNPIKIVKYENVSAVVTESILENVTSVRARLSVFDGKNGSPRFTRPMETSKFYSVRNVNYRGDLRAIGKDFIELCRVDQVNRMPSKSKLLKDLEYAFRMDVESLLNSLSRELI